MSGIPAGAGSLLGKRLGKFEILALLALGGTAEIYLARIGGAAGFEKYVVVKCLHDHLADDTEFVKMFLDEARLAAHLDHSNIVQTMELGEHENRYYMVMEFLAGLSLAMIVRRAAERIPGGRIPIPLVLNLLAQASAGLHYSHEKAMNGKPLNIVHRDISPQNLVVSFEGVVKVVDFGIAKAELRETRTRSGTIKGKFAYMSPEQCVANNVDRRTDVFALGVIAHELLTGRRLFKKPSPYETYQAVIECAVEPPSNLNHEIDPALDPLVMKAVAKDKENRYQTAEAFGDALLGYLHQRGKGSGPGEISRFFDSTFGQEIEEHGARMRELISGRDFSADTGVSWGDEDQPPDKRNETVDLSGRGSAMSLDTGDLVEQRGSAPSLNSALDDLGSGRDDDDEMPAEKTRIETNPLERLQELDKAAAIAAAQKQKTPPPALMPTQIADHGSQPKMPPSGALPLPPAPVPPKPGSGKTPAPSVSPKVQSGRFPELANLPTMIAEPDEDDHEASASGSAAATQAFVDPHGPTNISMEPVAMPNGAPTALPQRPPLPHQLAPTQALPPTPPRMAQPSSPPANVMGGYPVMDREMSAQIATGASVFPSDRQSSPSHPPPYMPQQMPMQPPPQNPQQLAQLASPVGQSYHGQVDWAAAAAAPAKALPPWKLAVLFIAAIGLALTITIIIAKIAR